jgi:hypothetical protein
LTSHSQPWKRCKVKIRGKNTSICYKNFSAQWYRAAGEKLLHIVIVKIDTGTIPFRVFFSTDATMSVESILTGYSGRWSIEVCFRELKQFFGFADSSARKKEAVQRTAPFVGLTYTLLVLWFIEYIYDKPVVVIPIRPWYRHKRGYSFEDILRTARRILAPVDVFDLRNTIANLHETSQPSSLPSSEIKLAS